MTELPTQHRVQAAACPHCGTEQTGATNMQRSSPPAAGDFSICMNCAGVCVFTDDAALRTLNDDDAEDLRQHPDALLRLATMRAIVLSFIHRNDP
jgi:hypothetical protein